MIYHTNNRIIFLDLTNPSAGNSHCLISPVHRPNEHTTYVLFGYLVLNEQPLLARLRPAGDNLGGSIGNLKELELSLLKITAMILSVLPGDFNIPNINWKDNCATDCHQSHSVANCLLDIQRQFGFKQLVNSPNRIQNILDLVFTNNDSVVKKLEVTAGISDHDMVLFDLLIYPERERLQKRKVFIKSKANAAKIKSDMSTCQSYFLKDLSAVPVAQQWDEFDLHQLYRLSYKTTCFTK